MYKTENFSIELEQIASLIKDHKVRILCGAGISYNSGVPLVGPLVKKVFEAFGATEQEYEIFKLTNYPFEAFMDTIGYKYEGRVENQVVEQLEKLFQIGSPNNNHYFISNLYEQGLVDKVVTTNFDRLIEKALEERNVSYNLFLNEREFPKINWYAHDCTLIKVHGCISDPISMRTTLAGVSSKILHCAREKVIENTFLTGPHEAVLVLGYSFSDHFDITPFLKKIGNRGKKVFIIYHHSEGVSIKKISQIFPQLSNLPGKVLLGSTDYMIKELWSKVLDVPYIENAITDHIQLSNQWYKIVEDLKEILSKEDNYRNFVLGNLFMSIQQTKMALKHYQWLLYHNHSDLYKGKGLIGLANIYRTEGDYDSIFKPSKEALKIAIDLKDNYGIITSYIHLGIYFKRKGMFAEALNCHNKAIETIKEALDFDPRTRLDYLSRQYYDIGTIYIRKQEFDEAFTYLGEAEQIAESIGEESLVAHIIFNKGIVCQCKAELDPAHMLQLNYNALALYSRSLEKARMLSVPTLIIDNLINIALLVSKEQGLEKLNEAAGIAYKIGNIAYQDIVKKHLDSI